MLWRKRLSGLRVDLSALDSVAFGFQGRGWENVWMSQQQAVVLLPLLVGKVKGDTAFGVFADGGALLGCFPSFVERPDPILPSRTSASALPQ